MTKKGKAVDQQEVRKVARLIAESREENSESSDVFEKIWRRAQNENPALANALLADPVWWGCERKDMEKELYGGKE